MEVDERADALIVFVELRREGIKSSVLGRVTRSKATVGFATWVRGRATLWRLSIPLKFPVTVSICANAGCVDSWARLAVFAPEAVGGLGVNKTCINGSAFGFW